MLIDKVKNWEIPFLKVDLEVETDEAFEREWGFSKEAGKHILNRYYYYYVTKNED